MTQKKNIYDSNLYALKKHHPDVFKKIHESHVKPLGELELLDNNAKNLKVIDAEGSTHYLHGRSGPAEDTAQFFNMVSPEANGVLIMMGFGLGVPSREILKNRPHIRHFFIFDSNLGVFKQALMTNDLSELISDNRTVFCLEEKPDFNLVFKKAYTALELEDIQILKNNPSFRLNPHYTELSEELFNYLNSFSVRGATTKTMGKKFTRNRFVNLKRFRHDFIIDSLSGVFKEVPAILIAGGPSLDKNIHQLKKLKGKALLFAVDAVVPNLLKNNIIPDFISSIDPQKITLEKFKGADIPKKGVSLICSAWVTPRVPFTLPVDRVIWTFGPRAAEKWINDTIGGKKIFIGAGTVAHLNLHVALDMGCSPIIFAGQDLAYSETNDHASNISLTNSTQMEDIFKSKGDWTWVKGFFGGKVKTSRSFLHNKNVFESIIEKNPSIKFINATEGGAFIDGADHIRLEQAVHQISTSKINSDQRISQIAVPLGNQKIAALDAQLKELIKIGDNILKQLKPAQKTSAEMRKEITRLKKKQTVIREYSQLPPPTQKKLVKIDKFSAKLDQQGLFWHLLDEVTFEGLRQSEQMRFDISTQSKDKNKYLNWLLKNIERFDYINGIRCEIISWLKKEVSSVIEFHEKEFELFEALEEEGNLPQKHLELAIFYADAGITSLALKYLENQNGLFSTPELHFTKGCYFAYRGDFNKSEKYFKKALSNDQTIQGRIDAFKKERAQEYFEFGNKWMTIDTSTSRNLFRKSLQYNPDQPEISETITQNLNTDLQKISLLLKEENYAPAKTKMDSLIIELENEPIFKAYLTPVKTAFLYGQAGTIYVREENFSKAYELYAKAIECEPDNPAHYIQLTDMCFSIEDYDNGVRALNKAIELDRSNAKYWELIGDHMAKSDSLNDALSAYEKCFLEMPENHNLLLKMGEIYSAMGQEEAAKEARRQYQNLLDSNR